MAEDDLKYPGAIILKEREQDFREFYASCLSLHQLAAQTFHSLLNQLLGHTEISVSKITHRVKDRDGCLMKFKEKYYPALQKVENYVIRDSITDLIGLRIVCLYEADVKRVKDLVDSQFEVIEVTDKTQILQADLRVFGYKGLHLDVRLSDHRQELPEYERLSYIRAEIQIRTIVQDAWSEVEHKFRYKRNAPATIQRRIIRMAALFELADQEFSAIHDEIEERRQKAFAKRQSLEQEDVATRLDALSFLELVGMLLEKQSIEETLLEKLLDDLFAADPNLTTNEAVLALRNFEKIEKYRIYLAAIDRPIEPVEDLRNCFYIYNKNLFHKLISSVQKETLEKWISNQHNAFITA